MKDTDSGTELFNQKYLKKKKHLRYSKNLYKQPPVETELQMGDFTCLL